jgi:hypothetical protein
MFCGSAAAASKHVLRPDHALPSLILEKRNQRLASGRRLRQSASQPPQTKEIEARGVLIEHLALSAAPSRAMTLFAER